MFLFIHLIKDASSHSGRNSFNGVINNEVKPERGPYGIPPHRQLSFSKTEIRTVELKILLEDSESFLSILFIKSIKVNVDDNPDPINARSKTIELGLLVSLDNSK